MEQLVLLLLVHMVIIQRESELDKRVAEVVALLKYGINVNIKILMIQ